MASAGPSGHQQTDCISHGIRVHPETRCPDRAFSMLSVEKEFKKTKKIKSIGPGVPITSDNVRIVCISDTHSRTNRLDVPAGDVLIHAGDFTFHGGMGEVQAFANFLATQPHKHKVVIAGNHELSFGYCDGFCDIRTFKRLLGSTGVDSMKQKMQELNINHPRELLPKDVVYLNNSAATVCGLKMWGSPWSPYFHGWAYNAQRGKEILKIWDGIPSNTDVVITHTPPVGVGDQISSGDRVGCVELYTTLKERVRPQLHVFGHIHEGYGLYTDGTTLYANASTCNINYKPINNPICIDLPLPEGFSKEDVRVEAGMSNHEVSREFLQQQSNVSQSGGCAGCFQWRL
ncbi:metallophosphoesterase MPPED2-like [Watersipora subatra]|uniref:metallophosphoesterase MPPED2-like n=1 Tax=Watersipora subatra TaxID=2589382 RepID=UPI00355B89EA